MPAVACVGSTVRKPSRISASAGELVGAVGALFVDEEGMAELEPREDAHASPAGFDQRIADGTTASPESLWTPLFGALG
jgi:hypothetical protein